MGKSNPAQSYESPHPCHLGTMSSISKHLPISPPATMLPEIRNPSQNLNPLSILFKITISSFPISYSTGGLNITSPSPSILFTSSVMFIVPPPTGSLLLVFCSAIPPIYIFVVFHVCVLRCRWFSQQIFNLLWTLSPSPFGLNLSEPQ